MSSLTVLFVFLQVGTVETFQGKEFDVVLVSTVRSNPKLTDFNQNITLGFLSHEKVTTITFSFNVHLFNRVPLG